MIIGCGSWMAPVDFDEAINLQVAQSLSEKFSYESKLVPTKIYHDKITTNGPIQYLMALMIRFFGIDVGRAIGLGLLGGLAAVSIYIYSGKSFILYCLLLFSWPVFALAHTRFMGEIFSITMIIVGMSEWHKWLDENNQLYLNWRSNRLLFSGIAFGVSISTKLFSAVVLLVLLSSLILAKYYTPDKKISIINYFKSIIYPLIIAYIFFFVQISFSIFHSSYEINTIFMTVKQFLLSHKRHVDGLLTSNLLQTIKHDHFFPLQTSIPAILILMYLLMLLIDFHLIFLIPAIFIVALIFFGHFDFRRLFVLIIPIMLVTFRVIKFNECCDALKKHICNRINMLVLITIIVSALFFGNSYLLKLLRSFNFYGAPHNYAYIRKSKNDTTAPSRYRDELIYLINKLPGPIFVKGFLGQFPEISLRTRTVFYDRDAAENIPLIKATTQGFLMFSAWDENVTNRNCGEIIYKEWPLVLCKFTPGKSRPVVREY